MSDSGEELPPRFPTPPMPAPVRGTAEFGQKIMRWGRGDAEARARIVTITREEMEKAGVTREMAEAWRDFYRNETARVPTNPSSRGRADLMQHVAELLSGGGY